MSDCSPTSFSNIAKAIQEVKKAIGDRQVPAADQPVQESTIKFLAHLEGLVTSYCDKLTAGDDRLDPCKPRE